jgi:hypothetical protein
VPAGRYLTGGPYRGWRRGPLWPERLLARYTHWRIRRRGARGGLFFVDRRQLIADQLRRLQEQGIADEPIAPL